MRAWKFLWFGSALIHAANPTENSLVKTMNKNKDLMNLAENNTYNAAASAVHHRCRRGGVETCFGDDDEPAVCVNRACPRGTVCSQGDDVVAVGCLLSGPSPPTTASQPGRPIHTADWEIDWRPLWHSNSGNRRTTLALAISLTSATPSVMMTRPVWQWSFRIRYPPNIGAQVTVIRASGLVVIETADRDGVVAVVLRPFRVDAGGQAAWNGGVWGAFTPTSDGRQMLATVIECRLMGLDAVHDVRLSDFGFGETPPGISESTTAQLAANWPVKWTPTASNWTVHVAITNAPFPPSIQNQTQNPFLWSLKFTDPLLKTDGSADTGYEWQLTDNDGGKAVLTDDDGMIRVNGTQPLIAFSMKLNGAPGEWTMTVPSDFRLWLVGGGGWIPLPLVETTNPI